MRPILSYAKWGFVKIYVETRRVCIRNNDTRRDVGTSSVVKYEEREKIKRCGHLLRMDPTIPAARVYNMDMENSSGGMGETRVYNMENISGGMIEPELTTWKIIGWG